jgi:DNA gyrase subunit A
VFAITSVGGVIRTRASEVRQTGRVTMGVRLMNLASGDTVVALARNAESADAESPEDVADPDVTDPDDAAFDSAEFEQDVRDDGNETEGDGV